MNFDFLSRFVRLSAAASKKPSRKAGNIHHRSLRFETLENRELLAVSGADFDQFEAMSANIANSATIDVGDTFATATTVSLSGNVYTTSETVGNGSNGTKDVDMYKLVVSASDVGKVHLFETLQTSGSSTMDTCFRLFNATGTQIAYDDDSGTGGFSKLVFTPTSAGTYYLGVSGYENITYSPTASGSGTSGAVGDYTLRVTRLDDTIGDTLATATAITFSGNVYTKSEFLGGGSNGTNGCSHTMMLCD